MWPVERVGRNKAVSERGRPAGFRDSPLHAEEGFTVHCKDEGERHTRNKSTSSPSELRAATSQLLTGSEPRMLTAICVTGRFVIKWEQSV